MCRKIGSNGESGLQKNGSNTDDGAESFAEACAKRCADDYAEHRAEFRADGCAEKNGTDANNFADAENYADVRAVPRAELRADAGVDDGKKDVWSTNCTILTR